jgi:hypothetical protein
MPTAQIQDWGEAFMTSLTGALAVLFSGIPRIIGFVLILVIGWFIASLIAKGVAALLRTVHFNDIAQRSGLTDFVHRMGIKTDASGFLAAIAMWFIRLIVMVVAFDALGLPAVSDVLRQLLLWLPNLVVAMVVLILGGLAAKAVSNLVRGATAEADLGNPEFLARIASFAVWGFAIVIAVNQIGIAATLVNTLFMGVVGVLVIGLGLSFGLGGKDTAGEIVRRWYERSRANSGKIEMAAERMEDQAARNVRLN